MAQCPVYRRTCCAIWTRSQVCAENGCFLKESDYPPSMPAVFEDESNRDALPPWRHRACVLSTPRAVANRLATIAALAKAKKTKETRDRNKAFRSGRKAMMDDAFPLLRKDLRTGRATQPTHVSDPRLCFICLTWAGAWHEAGLEETSEEQVNAFPVETVPGVRTMDVPALCGNY